MTTISIDSKAPRQVAPDLYGLFFEDINRAGDSGLYPEMLRNRAFEDGLPPEDTEAPEDLSSFLTRTGYREPFCHGEGVPAWEERVPYTPIPAWYADGAEMTLLREGTLDANRRAALKVRFRAGGRIRNIGYMGVSAQKNVTLAFYAFLKSEKETALAVSLAGHDGTMLAEGTITVPAGNYVRRDLVLVPNGDDPASCLMITSGEEAIVTFGFTSLMPAETFLGHGLRSDLVKLLKKTHPRFMRWPGGCVVEGLNVASASRFTDTVGPVWKRRSTYDLWHYYTTNGFGFHEFLQLCEDLNMEALYVVNCAMTCQAREPDFLTGDEASELLDQAFMALEYAMGDTTTQWGALRAEMGHPAPFRIKYLEIGNENDGPEYDQRYALFYEKLHAAYPEIILISNAHTETRGLPTQYVDEHYYSDWQFFAQSGHLYDHYPKEGPGIFLGEYAVTRGEHVGDLRSALSEVRFLMGTETNPEVVKLAAYAPLFENIHYKSWNPNLISFDNHRSCALPFLHALDLLGESHGTKVLSVKTDADRITPVKYGFAGLIAYEPGLRMLPPILDGKECEVCKEVVGHWIRKGEELVSDCTGNETLDSVSRYQIQLNMANGIFSSRKATRMKYTARIFMDENTPKFSVTVWAHNTTEPGVMSLYPDPDAPSGTPVPKTYWALNDTEYYTWTVENGTGSYFYLYRYQEHPLAEPAGLPVRMGEYNEFTILTDETGYDCYLNGTFIRHVDDRGFGRIEAVATEDSAYLYLKLLNQTDSAEEAVILPDVPVCAKYACRILKGDPRDRNTLDDPEHVHAGEYSAEGAGREFRVTVPAWSFMVLRLKKAERT